MQNLLQFPSNLLYTFLYLQTDYKTNYLCSFFYTIKPRSSHVFPSFHIKIKKIKNKKKITKIIPSNLPTRLKVCVRAPNIRSSTKIFSTNKNQETLKIRINPRLFKPPTPIRFDVESPPSQSLAILELQGLIFFAHFGGFCVARTVDIIASAKDIKDKGNNIQKKKTKWLKVLTLDIWGGS